MTEKETPLHYCIIELLDQLNWHGDKRQFTEALPHFASIADVDMFCDVMKNLFFNYQNFATSIEKIDSRLLPCLFIDKENNPYILYSFDQTGIKAFDGKSRFHITLKSHVEGEVYYFKPSKAKEKDKTKQQSLFYTLYSKHKKLVYHSLLLSFILNILALAVPLFIIAVYNYVIGTQSRETLQGMLIGVSIALISIYWLQKTRSHMLAFLSTRLDHDIGNAIFERLLFLDPVYTETVSVGAQVARIKDFYAVREFLASPLFVMLFDSSFIIIALIAIAVIAGDLVLIPIAMILVFVSLIFFSRYSTKTHVQYAVQSNAEQQEFLLETLNNLQDIKLMTTENAWQERYREISAASNLANFKTTLNSTINNAVADALVIGSGLAILCASALEIMYGNLNIAVLIALMILVWRVLAPVKTIYIALPKIQQIITSLIQINRLMRIKPEVDPKNQFIKEPIHFKGSVRFERVSFRYPNAVTPTLLGISFQVKPGQLVAITGQNGSGKSTIMKLLLDMYRAQAGKIYIGNIDIRQFNPVELRKAISYIPQQVQFFYGTIAQNLKLAHPTATEEELILAAKKASVLTEIQTLPEGFNTRIRDRGSEKLSSSFLQGLNLARGYLKPADILLMDEPAIALDETADSQFLKALQDFKGDKTIIMVTHRPSHLKMADEVLVLEQGQLILKGSPEQILPKLTAVPKK